MENLAFNGLFNYLIFGMGTIYFTYSGILLFLITGKEWISKSARLIIADDRIINMSNFYSAGEIRLVNITGVQLASAKSQRVLIVILKDPESYLAGKSFFARILLKKLLKKYGSPILFTEGSLRKNLNTIKELIETNMASLTQHGIHDKKIS